MFLKNASFAWFLDAHMNILINLENPSPDDKNLVSVVQSCILPRHVERMLCGNWKHAEHTVKYNRQA